MNHFKFFVLVGVALLLLLPSNLNAQLNTCEMPSELNNQWFPEGFWKNRLEVQGLPASKMWKVIDLGIFYTEEEATRLGGDAIAEARYLSFVNELNRVYARSQMRTVARLVALKKVGFVSSGSTVTDLNTFAASDYSNTGMFAGFRAAWGADVLVLMTSYGAGFAGGLYAVIGDSDLITFVHELGHVLGMNHSNYICNDPNDSLCQRSRDHVWLASNGELRGGPLALVARSNVNLSYSNPNVRDDEGSPTGVAGTSEGALVGDDAFAPLVAATQSPKKASVCQSDANRACLKGGRFQFQADFVRPNNRGLGVATPVANSDTAVSFRYGTLAPIQVEVACVAKKAKVTITGSLPKAVELSVFVIDSKTGRSQQIDKAAKVAFKPSATVTDLACK